jgi:hypothetical protein
LRFALLAPVLGIAAAALGAMPLTAGAATTLPTPESLTNCGGTLTPDASGSSQGEPNLLDYAFDCSTPISAYTITVDRVPRGTGNLDNYSPTANVVVPGGASISTTEAITCEGSTPSNGINCTLGLNSTSTSLSLMDAFASAQGSIDLVEPYCAYLPPKAKAGTPAVPQAIVSVVVTDNTGAEDGPFYLGYTSACKKVPATVPATPTKAKKKAKKKASRTADRRAGRKR